MGTTTERFYATRIYDNNYREITLDYTIRTKLKYNTQYYYTEMIEFDYLNIEFNLSNSPNVSRYIPTGNPYAHYKSKSQRVTGSPSLPRGRFEAEYSTYIDGATYFNTYMSGENTFSNIQTPSWVVPQNINVPIRNGLKLTYKLVLAIGMTEDYDSAYTVDGTALISYADTPYIDMTWIDVVPSINGLNPSSNVFVDVTNDVTLRSSINAKAYDGTDIDYSTNFIWRVQGSGTEHTIEGTGSEVTVPANTFPANSTIEWKVECTTEYGITSSSSWATISTDDEPPEKPTNLSPDRAIISGNEDNTFTWEHNSSKGTAQAKAELQISSDGSTFSALATVNGSDEFAVIEADTILSGTKFWRVRTYNADDEAGAWSDNAQIVVQGAPPAPGISDIVATPRAQITWQSAQQTGWRVKFTDSEGNVYDTGERYGNNKTFRSPIYLADGNVTAEVSVANDFGLWSTTEVTFNVANEEGDSINAAFNNGILNWLTSGEYDAFYILRNGVPVAETIENSFDDKSGNGIRTYQILGAIGDNYTLSNVVNAESYPKTVEIFDVENDGPIIQLYKRRDNPVEISRNTGSNDSTYWFSGSKNPTIYSSGHITSTYALEVTYQNKDSYMLDSLIDKICCIKDKTGWMGYGVLTSINHRTDSYTDVTLSFTIVDYDEEVDYE